MLEKKELQKYFLEELGKNKKFKELMDDLSRS